MKQLTKKSSRPQRQPAANFLHHNQSLRAIISKLAEFKPLQQLLATCLDPETQGHYQITSLEKNKINIVVENAHWATRLRYLTPLILAKLREYPGLHGLTDVQYKVRPANSYETSVLVKKTSSLRMSPTSARYILQTAQQVTDKHLREALEKLAENSEKS